MIVHHRGVSFEVTDGDHRGFWERVASGKWESSTFDVFDRFITPETTVVDVGAWIGPTTLYAAAKARRVIALEPDPVARDHLNHNLALNSEVHNVEVVPACLAERSGTVRIGVDKRAGDSESSIMFAGTGDEWEVPSYSLQDLLVAFDVERPLFLKVDVEGYEYALIHGLADALRVPGTIMHLSTHPHIFREQEARRGGIRLLRAVRSRVVGQWRSLLANRVLAMELSNGLYVYSEQMERLNLTRRLPRLILGQAFTADRALVVSSGPLS